MNTINDDTNEHEYNLTQSFYYDDNEFITTLESYDNPVTIMTLNCCSLRARSDLLERLIEKLHLKKTENWYYMFARDMAKREWWLQSI